MTTKNTFTFTGTGGASLYGVASDYTQTDKFIVSGDGNTIVTGGGGNVVVQGITTPVNGQDNATTIDLGDSPIATQAYPTSVNIALHGNHNSISGNDSDAATGMPVATLNSETVTITVAAAVNGVSGANGLGNGQNYIGLDNVGGTTRINLQGGGYNTVVLNEDVQNYVTLGAGAPGQANASVGFNTIDIGASGDLANATNLWSSQVRLVGGSNVVNGGDANFTIVGGNNSNTVTLGDGNNTVQLLGLGNVIAVGAGSNQINSTAGQTTVTIGGWAVAPTDGGFEPLGTDLVTLGGTNNVVNQVFSSVTGDSNVTVTGLAEMSTVTLGNGSDIVELRGDFNKVTVGDENGLQSLAVAFIELPGNGNSVTSSQDSTYVKLFSGTADTVTLTGLTASTVYGSGNTTTITSQAAKNTIVLGAGSYDKVSLTNAAATSTVTSSGHNDSFVVAGALVTLTASGVADTITASATSATITAIGGGDTITITSDTAAAGDTVKLVATGTGDKVSISGTNTVASTVTLGSNGTLYDQGGVATITGTSGETVTLDGSQAGSTVTFSGSNDTLMLQNNAFAQVILPVSTASKMNITLIGDVNQSDTATIGIANFGKNDSLTLQNLGFSHYGTDAGGFSVNAPDATHTGYYALLGNGGEIDFSGTGVPTSTQFHFA